MSTWTLWRLIRTPPRNHPLFQQSYSTLAKGGCRGRFQWKSVFGFIVFLVLLFTIPGLFLLALVLLAVLPLALPMIVNIYPLQWVMHISSTIGWERERGDYDLLCILPPGSLGIGWIMSMAGIYRNGSFGQLRTIMHMFMAVFVGGSLLTIFSLVDAFVFPRPGISVSPETQFLPFNYVSTIIIFYADYIQTVCLSVTLVLATANRTTTRTDARVLGVALFLLVQVTVYLCTVLIEYALLPGIFASLALSGLVPQVGLVVMRFALLCGLREIAIILLWRQIALDYGDVEVSQLVRDLTPGAVLAPIEPAVHS